MIRLFIDSHEMVLPLKASVAVVEQNPMLTKEGDKTLDIDIPLTHPSNRAAYRYIDRINNTVNLKKDREVRLYDGPRLILFGTEVILEHTARSVKIQILAGNSELNYKMKNRRIRETDLGRFVFDPGDAAEANTNATGPCCFPPVSVKDESATILRNNFTRRYLVGPLFDLTPVGALPPASELVPQLYMYKALELLMGVLGYRVVFNVFETDPVLRRRVIANGNPTFEYNEMFPNMEMSDFITYVEEAFSVHFNTCNKERTVRIERFSDYLERETGKEITVLDGHTVRGVDVSEVFSGFVYKSDGSNHHKRMILKDPRILEREKVDFSTFANLEYTIRESTVENLYNAGYLYHVRSNGTNYYISKENSAYLLTKIGVFTDTGEGEKKELSCVPCPCLWQNLDFQLISRDQHGRDVIWKTDIGMYIPLVQRTVFDSSQVLDDAVMNGVKEEDAGDVINTFFFTGEHPLEMYYGMSRPLLYYPLAFEDWTDVFFRTHGVDYSEKSHQWAEFVFDRTRALSFRPGGSVEIIEEYIDTEKEYVFDILSDKIAPTDLVNIRNRLFVCKEINVTYSHGRTVRSGTFHAVKTN